MRFKDMRDIHFPSRDVKNTKVYRTDDNLRDILGSCPNYAGLYLFETTTARPETLYIGRAGTWDNVKMKFKQQGLQGRIQNKHTGLSREDWIRWNMIGANLLEIRICWRAFAKPRKLPSALEAELLQSFFDDYERLPWWNTGF